MVFPPVIHAVPRDANFPVVLSLLERARAELDGLGTDVAARLDGLLRDAGAALAHAQSTVADAIDNLPDSFALFDPEDRLVACNDRFRRVLAGYGMAVAPGTAFRDVVRASAYGGLIVDAIGNPAAWMAERLRLHGQGALTLELQLRDGSWRRVNERRTSGGYTVLLYTDTTELNERSRKLAEMAGSNGRLAAAVAATTTGISIAENRGVEFPLVFVNEAFCRLTGYTAEEALGRDCRFLQGPETGPAVVARISDALRAGEPASFELVNYRKDGTPFWNELRISPVRDPAGRVTHFIGVQTDVTVRRQAAMVERRHTQQLRELAQASLRINRARSIRDVVRLVAEEARVLAGARQGMVLLDGADESLRDVQACASFDGDSSAAVPDAEAMAAVLRTLDRDRLVLRIEPGGTGASGALVAAIIDRSLRRIGAIVLLDKLEGAFSEADEAVLLQLAQSAAVAMENACLNDLMREAQRDLSEAHKVAKLASWRWDVARNRAVWSDEMFAIAGIRPESFGGGMEDVLACVAPADRERVQATLDRTVAQRGHYETELRFVQPDGRVMHCWAEGHCVFDGEGRVTAVSGVVQDITDRRIAEEALRQAQKMEAVGQLTGGIAHDFNNLLTVILGNTELLMEDLAGDTERHAMAEASHIAAQRGAELTQQLLAFARKQVLEPRPIDLNRLVLRMVDLLRRTLGEDIAVSAALDEGAWHPLTDPAQIESAILNLALNARDAMPDGGQLLIETANVRVDQGPMPDGFDLPPGDYVLLCVSDNGVGMPAEVAQRAFEPFFTTKEVGKGSGLGLSQVYGFVKQSGGLARIRSAAGAGTWVKLYLPRAAEVPAAAPEPAADAMPYGSERVLVVEDEPMVRLFVVEQMRALGYAVAEAANGEAALALLEAGEPVDLLFTDVVMPGRLNGPQLADAAAALRPGLKVLFSSGYAEGALAERGNLAEGMRLLHKPYRKQDLAQAVREALVGVPYPRAAALAPV